MLYPSLEQYNIALQHPNFALSDPSLKNGKISKTGLGLPLALCGGFALTYTINIGSKKYAIRCFHKNSRNIEQRYKLISNKLKQINSPFFVDFVFQPQGIRVESKNYPIVRMEWADGLTMGEFIENYHRDHQKISNLTLSLKSISEFLEIRKIGHGDIQPGNVMVSSGGQKIQLIDYDGVYVEDLKSMGSSEIGHRNFQHPKRDNNYWDPTLDRFSLITLNLSLRALMEQPELWAKTKSDGDSVLFRANDYVNPDQSETFKLINQLPRLKIDLENFAHICRSDYRDVPTLEDYLQQKNIPKSLIIQTPQVATKYYSPYDVLDASNYDLCLQYVGDKVELIGQVEEVNRDQSRYGSPYIFINFGYWRGKIVKAAIWSEGINKIVNLPDDTWENKWISVVGLLEPPYHSNQYGYTYLAVNITQSNQIYIISENEANFRLGKHIKGSQTNSNSDNKQVIDEIRKSRSSISVDYSQTQKSLSRNQTLLNEMKKGVPRPPQQAIKTPPYKQYTHPPKPSYGKQSYPTKKKGKDQSGYIYVIIFLIILIYCYLTNL